MASTRSRPRGREHARPSAGGVAAEHATKIYTVAVIGIVVIVAFLALTSVGHVIDAATQHFMLYYAGVFALIALCASVGLGLVATDRMFMSPGHRVLVQSAHRAASFGAVAFLIIHIVTEILAQRVHVLDAVIPFLSPFRTFYIGLGTIASDLIILLVITGILRGRFNESGKAWRWRAIHYTSYLAFVFGVWHGLLGGRAGKPYVDWSYGFVVAFVLLGLAVRVLSNSLRPKENLSAPPVDSRPTRHPPRCGPPPCSPSTAARAVAGPPSSAPSTGSQPVLSAPVSAQVLTALPAGGAETEQRPAVLRARLRRAATVPGRATVHGNRPHAAAGHRADAQGGDRFAAARRHRAHARAATGPMPRLAPGRCRGWHRADAARRHRADAPSDRAHAPGHRAHAAAGTGPLPPVERADAAREFGPDAARGIRSQAARRVWAHAAGRDRSDAALSDRGDPGPYPASGPYPAPLEGRGPGPVPCREPRPGRGHRCDDRRPADWGTGPAARPATGTGPSGGRGPRGANWARPRPTGPIATGTGAYRRPATGPMPQPVRRRRGPAIPTGAATRRLFATVPAVGGRTARTGRRPSSRRRLVPRGAAVGQRLPRDRPQPQVPGAGPGHAWLPGLP